VNIHGEIGGSFGHHSTMEQGPMRLEERVERRGPRSQRDVVCGRGVRPRGAPLTATLANGVRVVAIRLPYLDSLHGYRI
jgi:hypothetical protein